MAFKYIFSIATYAALASAAACAPGFPPPGGPWGPIKGCLTNFQATNIVSQYATLLVAPTGPNFNQTAEALLSSQFAVYSDSINILANKTLGGPSYPSKEIFIAAQAQTPAIPVLTTDEIFIACEKIVWRWTGSGIGNNKAESKGMITMNISPQGQIDTVYSEFNTAAWWMGLGFPECKQS